MTPHNIDPMRFQNLLRYGISSDALMQFFRDNKAALLSAAVKVDNLPPTPSSARRAVAGFNAKAHAILGRWIARHLVDAPGLAPDEVVARFRSVEVSGVTLSSLEREEFDTWGLRELYCEQPNSAWIGFLQTPIVTENFESPSISSADWVALASWWLGNGPRPLTEDSTIAAVATLREAVDRRDPLLLTDTGALQGVADDLKALIQTVAEPPPEAANQRGVIASGPVERTYDSKLDYTSFTVIATNRSARTVEPFFVVAEAFIDDAGEIFSLPPNELRQAIPSDARIILHGDKGFPNCASNRRVLSRTVSKKFGKLKCP